MKNLAALLFLFLLACGKPTDQQTVKPEESVGEPVAEESVDLTSYCQTNRCRKNVKFYLQTDKGLIDETADLYWPVIQGENTVSLLAGEQIYITGELVESKIINLAESFSDNEAAISFNLTQNDDGLGMMLEIKNPYDFTIKVSIDMVDFDSNLHPTSSCPVVAGGGVFEMWPHPIPELLISEIRKIDVSEGMTCIY